MAITNTVATIPGIVVPIFVGVLTHGNVSIYDAFLVAGFPSKKNIIALFYTKYYFYF